MCRSTLPHPHLLHHTYLYAGLALLGAVVIIVFTFVLSDMRAVEIPAVIEAPAPAVAAPAAPANTAPSKVDMGAGYTLDTRTGQIVAPAANLKPQPRTLDIGAGHVLQLSGSGEGQIVAPARPSTAYQKIDMGAGYTLEISGDSGTISAPVQLSIPQQRVVGTLDLGAGYTLVLYPSGGTVVAPASEHPVQPAVHRTDIGGGYWLETWQDGGQIVSAGTR